MHRKLITIILLLFISKSFAQKMDSANLMGTWKIKKVSIDKNIVGKDDKIKLLKTTFIDGTITLNGNGVFDIDLNGSNEITNAFEQMSSTNWVYEGNIIKVGYKSNDYSYINFYVNGSDSNIWSASFVVLELEKTASQEPRKFKKLKEKKDKRSAVINSQLPVYRTKEFKENEAVPFTLSERPPMMPNCTRTGSTKEDKKCTAKELAMFVNRKFNTDLASTIGMTGVNIITVTAVIGEDGYIYNIEAEGPHPELEEEGRRVFGLLPRLTPALQDGKPISVKYTLPITFSIVD